MSNIRKLLLNIGTDPSIISKRGFPHTQNILEVLALSETIGAKLRTLRKAKELTQDELAALIGVKRATISNYEINRRQPSLSELERLAEFFGVGLDYFSVEVEDGALDLVARAQRLFAAPDVPAKIKEKTFKEIMRLYLELDRS